MIAVSLASQPSIDEAAHAFPIPVVNAGSAEHDPCRVIADLLTLREHFGSLTGLRIAYVGADQAIPASLREAGDMLGMDVIHAPPPTPVHHPDAYGQTPEPDSSCVEPQDAVRGAHVVYTDAWVQGSEQGRRGGGIWDAATHQVTNKLRALANDDADVAHPELPNLPAWPRAPGLLELLTNDDPKVSDATVQTNIDNLSVLPAGAHHRRATELLASEQMATVLRELASSYSDRIVIFDSPPLLPTTEARTLAAHMGQIVMVVAADSTRQHAVNLALETIEDCEIVLMMLNKADKTDVGTYYGYYADDEPR
mgnify:CR=1 FL=1